MFRFRGQNVKCGLSCPLKSTVDPAGDGPASRFQGFVVKCQRVIKYVHTLLSNVVILVIKCGHILFIKCGQLEIKCGHIPRRRRPRQPDERAPGGVAAHDSRSLGR